MKTTLSLLAAFCGTALSTATLAAEGTVEELTSPVGTRAPSFLQRDTLTGDWFGVRTNLANKGLVFDLSFTEFYQGLFAGDGNDDFEFGGRADALVHLDTGKLGLWPGGGFHTHLEYRFGEAKAFRGGALWPVNTGLVLPLGEYETVVASSIYYGQRLGDSFSFLLGKINAVDLLASDPFFGGWGTTRFMNIAFVAPPSGLLPPVIMGGIANYQLNPFTFTFMAYDPNDQTSEYWVDRLFADGVNLSLAAKWSGEVFGRATSVSLTGIYSTKTGADLSDILLPPDLGTGTGQGAWNVSVSFAHLLYERPDRPGKGFGVYGKLGHSDGNPTPIGPYFIGGFAGHGVWSCRPRDSFGIGYYYYGFSKDLKDALFSVRQYSDEQGAEVFYSFAVTPWFRLSADLQWITPGNMAYDDALVGGLRANFIF